jgi:hypothetical protein
MNSLMFNSLQAFQIAAFADGTFKFEARSPISQITRGTFLMRNGTDAAILVDGKDLFEFYSRASNVPPDAANLTLACYSPSPDFIGIYRFGGSILDDRGALTKISSSAHRTIIGIESIHSVSTSSTLYSQATQSSLAPSSKIGTKVRLNADFKPTIVCIPRFALPFARRRRECCLGSWLVPKWIETHVSRS